MGRGTRILEANYGAIRNDIFKFCEALHFEPTWQQKDLLEAVQRRDKRIAVKSGQGPGKTTVSTVVGLWWALQGVGAKVIVSAPTMRQCKDVWLAECRRIMQSADPWLQRLIKVQTMKVVIAGQRDWGIQAMTATSPESAQGFHEKKLKVILEEASGIPRGLIEQFKGTLSNPGSAMLQIGNPNTRDCAFFDSFNSKRHLWTTMTFNAEETPRSEWFDPQRNEDLAEEFGRNSDVYRVRVLGEFPHADPNCVMSSEDIEQVCDSSLMYKAAARSSTKQFGIDLARFGGDESTLYRRSGEAIVQWTRHARTDPAIVIEQAMKWQLDCGWRDDECFYVPDAGGMGQGVMHILHRAGKQVMEFHNGSKATDSKRFANRITEAWFNLARKVGKKECYLPNDNTLIQQLCTRQYYMDRKGKIILETKDEYKKRGLPSPDRADAVVLAFYDQVQAAMGSVVVVDRPQRRVGINPR